MIAALLLSASVVAMPAKPVKKVKKEVVEVLCVKDGFAYYNGLVTDFKAISKTHFTFFDLTWTQKRRDLNGFTCYKYTNGNFGEDRKSFND